MGLWSHSAGAMGLLWKAMWRRKQNVSVPIKREKRGQRTASRKQRETTSQCEGTEYGSLGWNISHSDTRGKDERQRKQAQNEKERKDWLNCERQIFISCAVLNAKDVSAYCRACFLNPLGVFLVPDSLVEEEEWGGRALGSKKAACLSDIAKRYISLAVFPRLT